jgi:osmotically-inducible protein OsmY
VTLFGQVVNPGLKASAEKAVERIAGVGTVDNELQVLPADVADNDIRAGVYRAIALALQPGNAIHVVVDNQSVTLVGTARTEGEKNLAGILSHGVPLVGNVTNELVVAR